MGFLSHEGRNRRRLLRMKTVRFFLVLYSSTAVGKTIHLVIQTISLWVRIAGVSSKLSFVHKICMFLVLFLLSLRQSFERPYKQRKSTFFFVSPKLMLKLLINLYSLFSTRKHILTQSIQVASICQ